MVYHAPQNITPRPRRGNLLPAIEDSLPGGTFTLLKTIAETASEIDMPLYLVGGSVRDILLRVPVKDLDVVVEGNAALLAFKVSKELSGEVLNYSQFGTATVKVEGQSFDLATARQETYPQPGALPKVAPSTIQEDLGRRDFSINAMAISLSGPKPGSLIDLHGGKHDLRLGLIRILHPRSFIDDATRILRAMRYAERLDFKLEEATRVKLLEAVHGGILDTISGARIRRELGLMFEERQPHLALARCGELGILRAIYPPIGDGSGVLALAGTKTAGVPLAYLAALSHPLAIHEGEAFAHRLHMPSAWAKVVRDTMAVRLRCEDSPLSSQEQAPMSCPHIGESQFSKAQLRSFLDRFSLASIQINALLSGPPQVRKALELYLNELRYVNPSLNGRDLISLGIAKGPMVGEILQKLKDARTEGRITTREEEMRLVEDHITMKGR